MVLTSSKNYSSARYLVFMQQTEYNARFDWSRGRTNDVMNCKVLCAQTATTKIFKNISNFTKRLLFSLAILISALVLCIDLSSILYLISY